MLQRSSSRSGRGMRPGEKAKNFKGTWAKLLTNCKKYWGAMIFAIICAGIGTVLTLIGPDKLSKMTDLITEGVMTGIDMDGIKRIGITLICFYGCSALLSLVQNLIMGYVTQQVSKGLRATSQGRSTACRCGFTIRHQQGMYYPV